MKASPTTTGHGDTSSNPKLLIPGEVAAILRTSKTAIYAMIERRQLPGVVRIGRRVLVEERALIDWLGRKSTPSLER